MDASNHLCADFEDYNSGVNHPITGVGTITVDSIWHHVAATYDQPSGIWNLYIDGVLDQTLTISGTDLVRTPRYDSIQKAGIAVAMDSAATVEGRFAGVIDEVRIWNKALPQATIQSNRNLESPSDTTGLIGHWSMNEGSGSSISDSAGPTTYETGTSAGSPAWFLASIRQSLLHLPPHRPSTRHLTVQQV
ncbi:MAG: LamG domain-containing protein [Anaerolineales bacterium]|nr:LamG domain-containing protein [Anaerolineales bacterium]